MSWLAPPFDQAFFAQALRKPFASASPLPSLVLPSAIESHHARQLRVLVQPALRPFELADQGRFHEAAGAPHLGLLEELFDFAQGVSGRSLRVTSARTQVFRAGDYALRLEDSRRHRPPAARWLELTLDLSAGPCPDARVVYSVSPTEHLVIAQDPGQIALVERAATETRFDRYLSAAMGRRTASRMRVTLVDRKD